MGTKYPSQSATGYNASPPSDDGTAVSTNEVKWSFIKGKLGDPVKDLADNINTALGTHFNEEVVDKATAFTTTAAEHKKTINITASATISLGDASTMAAGYIVTVKNSHSAANTVDLITGADTLDGTAAGSVSLAPDAAMTFVTNAGADGYFIRSTGFGDDLIVSNDLTVTGVATITGGQIAFPATQAPSADVNTLDDYQEGTFTPTLQDDSGSDGESQTYSDQSGDYTKIGNMVFYNIRIAVTSLGALTGTQVARIANLPFAAATGTEWAVNCARGANLALPAAGQNIGGYIRNGNDYIELWVWDSTSGSSGCQVDYISADGILNFSGQYQI